MGKANKNSQAAAGSGFDETKEIMQVTPKEGPITLSDRVRVEMNGTAPHHKDGEITEVSPVLADKIEANGWGKILAIAFFILASFGAFAQNDFFLTQGSATKVNTVTNAGTSTLISLPQLRAGGLSTAVQVTATKTSGTVAGTISLLGSIDGTNFKAILLAEGATALNTYTATDVASQTFIWRLTSPPYSYYQVSWTGTGTMVATFTAKIANK